MKLYIPITIKIALLVCSSTLAVFAAILFYSRIYSENIVLSDAETIASNLALSRAGEIDSKLSLVASAAVGMASAMEFGKWTDESIRAIIRNVISQNENIYGSTVAFEPYGFTPDIKYYSPYYYKVDKTPRFVQLGTDSYDYPNRDWYKDTLKKQTAMWTDPYYDEGGGETLMMTFTCPFFWRDLEGFRSAIRGVVGVDVSVDGLTEMVAALKILQTGYAFLIDDDGRILSHPNKSWVMTQTLFSLAEKLQEPKLSELGNRMLAESSGFLDMGSCFQGKDSSIAFVRLRTTGWSLGVVFPRDENLAGLKDLQSMLGLMALGGVMLLVAVGILLAKSLTRPLLRVVQATGEIAHGNLSVQLPDVHRGDELGDLARSFKKMSENLKKYIKELTETTAVKERIESELMIAAEIQSSMLPSACDVCKGRDEFDIYATMKPAKEIGGDFYDCFLLDDDRLCVAVGDVADKGVPAALFMAVTKYLLEETLGTGARPDDALKRLNRQLLRNNKSCTFVTIFVGILDLTSGEFTYANGGHNAPLLSDSEGSTADFLEGSSGPVVGVFETADYSLNRVFLEPGSTLVLYTDGITEATNKQGNSFSEESLRKAVLIQGPQLAESTTKTIVRELETFCDGADQHDDITILTLVFRRKTVPEK
jgi:phosphoserine phosphatase RsbU/P